jgi:hypothetical protein
MTNRATTLDQFRRDRGVEGASPQRRTLSVLMAITGLTSRAMGRHRPRQSYNLSRSGLSRVSESSNQPGWELPLRLVSQSIGYAALIGAQHSSDVLDFVPLFPENTRSFLLNRVKTLAGDAPFIQKNPSLWETKSSQGLYSFLAADGAARPGRLQRHCAGGLLKQAFRTPPFKAKRGRRSTVFFDSRHICAS